MSEIRPRSAVAALIAIGTVARIVLAGWIGLGVDESYAVAVARPLSLSYFDHPPLVFWIPGALVQMTGSYNAVLLRLPFILLFAGTTWLMFRLGALLFSERAGLYAALLMSISPVFSLTTGGWILPDGPLMFAMLATVLGLATILFEPDTGRATARWLLVGGGAGMAALSKYHAIFLLFGAALLLITDRNARAWLAHPGPYVAIAVAVVMALPVFVWNAQHDWASLRFQGGRAHATGLHFNSLAENLAGQALYILPWIWLGLVWQLIRALRAGPRDRARWFVACFALGPIVVFTLASLLGDRGLPHWSAPGFLFAFPLLGASAADLAQTGHASAVRRTLSAAGIAFLLLVGIAASQTATGWLARAAPTLFRRGDPTLEALDWTELQQSLAQRGLPADSEIIIAGNWIDGAKLGFALAPARVFCVCADPRGFRYSADLTKAVGHDALVLLRARDADSTGGMTATIATRFRSVEHVGTFAIHRRGTEALRIAAFRGHTLLEAR